MMHAKILALIVLAVLVAGCTTPDLPWIPNGDVPDPGAPTLKKAWNPETQTITISTLDNTPRLTIQKISSKPDLCTFEEVLEIKSFVDYDLNELKDFRARWQKHKGQHNITKVEWFILKNQSYDVTVNDYETIQVEETQYNNETEEYYNVTVNQTVLIGNHSEVRYHDIWKPFLPVGKSIYAGQTYTVKIVYHKPPELGDIRIQTILLFRGVECEELTWWNTSWDMRRPILINNTGGDSVTDYQLMSENISSFDIDALSSRIVNETSGLQESFWNETIDNSGNLEYVWCNFSSLPSGSWINLTYYIYYQSVPTANSVSDGDTTFLQYHGSATGNYLDSAVIDITTTNIIFESSIKPTVSANNIHIGLGDTQTQTGDYFTIICYGDGNLKYLKSGNEAVQTFLSEAPALSVNNYHRAKMTWDGTTLYGYWDDDEVGSGGISNNIPDENMGLTLWLIKGSVIQDWSFVRKYTINESELWTVGAEESVIIITAYTPSTPLSKTTGDSQLFTVNTSENSQCRWYINGSLKQTNSTDATRHEYRNSSLEEGYWNFTATANTTDRTSSQTWWVTVAAAGTFEQDMYINRWMYVTYLNSSNTNPSEFFTDLSPYYLSFYNATDQKTYNYKSGRWEKYADKIIKPGEVAMLRYTSNIMKTRDNADGTFGFTLKTGLNHIGHSYNGTRNLTWYNTTIASANLATITHQNPETGTLSTFTYGSADNGSVDVLQGCGVEVNVTADTVISGL